MMHKKTKTHDASQSSAQPPLSFYGLGIVPRIIETITQLKFKSAKEGRFRIDVSKEFNLPVAGGLDDPEEDEEDVENPDDIVEEEPLPTPEVDRGK